ncbi:hypothetical protein GCM10009557_93010 [Virgisporangium ochraceum]|uniref:Uncharacterized protein n=1 Tax=Virgisporangium ochraceum TaxID=65505 RepID=A0A8J3ZP97_9ACTN|nr:hypothetical protein [Virgisporangium ochraceum]GIJ67879.1 hypothetical protein Voc01_027960 [Virgisporangium ochraceum]
MTRLVFPVGQFGGAIRRPSEGIGFSIRRGDAVVTLEPDPGNLWLAAHGRPGELDTTVWTRDAVSDAPAALWSTLTGPGLIAEADPDEPEAVDFARAHRLLPRMHGLGNRAEHPDRFMAGYASDGMATFSWHQWRLWRESHLEPSLWDGCERLVENERGAGREVDARALLADTMRNLHIMFALNLAYLDVAR